MEKLPGTSLAAAQTAGIAALLFEWAVIRGNEPYFSGSSVRNYLTERGGAGRGPSVPQPGVGIREGESLSYI